MNIDAIIGTQDVNRDFGKDITSALRIRDTAKRDLAQSRMYLTDMGVKSLKDGNWTFIPGLNLKKFQQCNNQEFTWEAEMKDGSVVRQFGDKEDKNFSHIDQVNLKFFRWVSNFDYDTDNTEKRVIISLNFETGEFEFLNGYVPQSVRGDVINSVVPTGERSLVMKIIRRTDTAVNQADGRTDEVTYYNRYLIGCSFPTGEKRILCIEPNGLVHLWHDPKTSS